MRVQDLNGSHIGMIVQVWPSDSQDDTWLLKGRLVAVSHRTDDHEGVPDPGLTSELVVQLGVREASTVSVPPGATARVMSDG